MTNSLERDLVLGSIRSAGLTKLTELTDEAASVLLLVGDEDDVDSSSA